MLIFYTMGIAEALRIIREKIKNSAVKAGRHPGEIKLIVVTKAVEAQRIIEAINAGALILGENRVQEAKKKIQDTRYTIHDKNIEWHLIGNLQKNKAKYAVQLFDLIHTIDSIELADEVNKQAEKINKIQKVLVQVKLSEEETKHGIHEKSLTPLVEKIKGLNNLKLEGLMTIPPFFEDAEKARPNFRKLREIRDAVNSSLITRHSLLELSMGMSNDFEVAIEEGATMVRIGTAIFGERNAD